MVVVVPSARYAVAEKVWVVPASSVVASGETTRRVTSGAGGTTTTTAVSAFRPRPRPITLKVPVRLEENVPFAVIVPPVELHTVVVDVAPSPRNERSWPRNRTA